jgi:hypothetical protein
MNSVIQTIVWACKEFCVCEPYDGSHEGRGVWPARSTTTGSTGSFWTG